MPASLLPVAEVGSFEINGWLCLDLASRDSADPTVHFWPDVAPEEGVVESAYVAQSLSALLALLQNPVGTPPEWLPLVQHGDVEGLGRWLDRNPSRLRETDTWGWTALDHAVFEERIPIVELLFQKRDVTPSMVFYDALVDGRFVIARGTLPFGVEAEFVRPSLACKAPELWTDIDTVRAFLDAGADVEHVEDDKFVRNRPLHFAAAAGALDAVAALLERGADPAVKNKKGVLARDLAALARCEAIVTLLDKAVAARPARAKKDSHLRDELEEVDLHSVAITGAARGLGEESIAKLEDRLQARLPGEYRAFLKRYNGGTPRPARLRIRLADDDQSIACEIERFLTVGEVEPGAGDVDDIEEAMKASHDWGLPDRFLPIARGDDDFSGGLVCISLSGKDRGRIEYYPQPDGVESETYLVAKTLGGFFELLSKSKKQVPVWASAIENGNLVALQGWFDEAGAGALKIKHRGRTPLEIAITEGRADVVRWLIDRGAKPKTAFEMATEAGQTEIMRDLLLREQIKEGIAKNLLGSLTAAPRVWRDLELVRQLVDLGADVNEPGGSGMTPLMIAAQQATPEVLRFLLSAGARTGVWSPQGEMALHRATCTKRRSEMLEKARILIDAGESLHARAPLAVLPDHVQKTLHAMQMPLGAVLDQAGRLSSLFQGILGSLAQDPRGLLSGLSGSPPPNPYRDQFQRTAAELLREIHKYADAAAELEAHESRKGTPDKKG
jgi:ankyrin repeat protein